MRQAIDKNIFNCIQKQLLIDAIFFLQKQTGTNMRNPVECVALLTKLKVCQNQ